MFSRSTRTSVKNTFNTAIHIRTEQWVIGFIFRQIMRMAPVTAIVIVLLMNVITARSQQERIIDLDAGPLITLDLTDATVLEAITSAFEHGHVQYRIEPEAANICMTQRITLQLHDVTMGYAIWLCSPGLPIMWFDDNGVWIIGLDRVTIDRRDASKQDLVASVFKKLLCDYVFSRSPNDVGKASIKCTRTPPGDAIIRVRSAVADHGGESGWLHGCCWIRSFVLDSSLPKRFNPSVTCKFTNRPVSEILSLLCNCCNESLVMRFQINSRISYSTRDATFEDVVRRVLELASIGRPSRNRFEAAFRAAPHGLLCVVVASDSEPKERPFLDSSE